RGPAGHRLHLRRSRSVDVVHHHQQGEPPGGRGSRRRLPVRGTARRARSGRGAALRRLRARPPRQRTCGPHPPDPSARPADPPIPLSSLPPAQAPPGSPICSLAWWASALVLALSSPLLVEPSAQLYLAVAQSGAEWPERLAGPPIIPLCAALAVAAFFPGRTG